MIAQIGRMPESEPAAAADRAADHVDDRERIETTLAALLAACEARSVPVTADGRVSEATTERLLGYCPGALRQARAEGRLPIPHYRLGRRVTYRLADIALHIERARVSSRM
jgi:hypothetical protein